MKSGPQTSSVGAGLSTGERFSRALSASIDAPASDLLLAGEMRVSARSVESPAAPWNRVRDGSAADQSNPCPKLTAWWVSRQCSVARFFSPAQSRLWKTRSTGGEARWCCGRMLGCLLEFFDLWPKAAKFRYPATNLGGWSEAILKTGCRVRGANQFSHQVGGSIGGLCVTLLD
jgi:hypothetical protein